MGKAFAALLIVGAAWLVLRGGLEQLKEQAQR